MTPAIKAIVAHPNNGRLTALRSDYSLMRQEPDHENVLLAAGGFAGTSRPYRANHDRV
jgi:hypothetical protein